MNCEQAASLLFDYEQGSLGPQEKALAEAHLEHCQQCQEIIALWNALAYLPVEQPNPESRVRFQAMLDTYEGMQSRSSMDEESTNWRKRWFGSNAVDWLRSPAVTLACAVVLIAAGVLIGRSVDGIRDLRGRQDAGKTDSASSQELAAMHSELTNMRQLVVLSLLEQQSANERLQGVAWTTKEKQLDPKVLAALLQTLRYDSSVNVRLAALDALGQHGNQPQVRTGLIEALQTRQSPLVQVGLIDSFVELRDANALDELKKLDEDPHLNPAVRRRAEQAIQELSAVKM
jgi:HEAT repeat protein